MLYEAYAAADAAKDRIKRAEREAAENWRFRHIKSPESKIATAIITSVLGLFLR